MTKARIQVLLLDHDENFAKRIETILQKDTHQKYTLLWKSSGDEGIKEVKRNSEIDVILTEYFLPDQNGLEVARTLEALKIRTPIIFLTINKDFDTVVEIMKLGACDYIMKDEISAGHLCKVISEVCEQHRSGELPLTLEITAQRLEAMKNLVSRLVNEIEAPTLRMEEILSRWQSAATDKEYQRFLSIMKENVVRITAKIQRLRSLDTDKTIKYIKDIRMIDIS